MEAHGGSIGVSRVIYQGWIYWGGGCAPPLALARGGARGAIFHDKKKTIRDKMRFSNLSNNMMISEL